MEREDLGELFGRVTRRLIDAERPVLSAHGLSMWAYAVLSSLARRPAATQLALAASIGYDKTRLIALLDELERDGLIVREPDSSDRRARIVRLTQAGETRFAAAKSDIRAMESAFLADVSPDEEGTLVAVLRTLAGGSASGRSAARRAP